MTYWHAIGDAIHSIRSNTLRSLLTMLGIIIGVGALIAMLSIGAGAQARIAEQIASLGANVLMILPGAARGATGSDGNFIRKTRLTIRDAVAVAEGVHEISHAAPAVQSRGRVINGNRNWPVRINGTTSDYFLIRDWPIEVGRIFSRREEVGAGKVVIIGRSLKERLFGDDDPLGREVRVQNTPMTVIGVLAEKGQAGSGRNQDDIAFVPFKTAALRLGASAGPTPDAVSYILAKARDDSLLERAKIGTALLLRQRHRVADSAIAGFRVSDPVATMQARNNASRTIGWLLAAIASVSLIVGGISIMNIMLVSVTERTREIGLRMALGANRRQIGQLFLIEALLLCVAGGSLGVGVGVIVAWLVAEALRWPVLIAPTAIAAALGFSASVGLVFGFYPARRAASLSPAAALHRA